MWITQLIFLISFFVMSEPIALHNKQFKQLTVKILAYEKRVDALVAKKESLKEGAEMETTLSEILELQKELVSIRKNRRLLREHVAKTHPKEELIDDLSLLKDYDQKKKGQSDPAVDNRLDGLIKKLRSQYARSDSANNSNILDDDAVEIELANKKRDLKREAKDEYIKENIKTQLKVE